MFLKLDSEKYPIKNYGDLVGRICGSSARYCVDIFQSIQLMSNVAVVILTNGQSLSQVAKGRGCYTVLIMVWAIAGMILGQIKSLKRFSFLANFSVWLIVFVVIMSMVLVANLPPNYTAAGGTNGVSPGPVITQAIIYNNGNAKFTDQLTACMNIVFAYGFALVFVEFMAEMKRPWDFWKGMLVAQIFIFVVYLTYGLFMYSQQGQFVVNPANQGIPDSQWAWQTVGNVFSMVASLIGAVLYGNIGVKIIYHTFCQRPLRLPSFESKYGRLIWIAAVIIYWIIGFVLAAAIPHVSDFVSLVGAVCTLQFSYTFPPLMMIIFNIRVGAAKGEEVYNPHADRTYWFDYRKYFSRWVRGYKDRWVLNTFNFVVFLASLATAVLGIYSSVLDLIQTFQEEGSASSFTCKSPVA